MRQIGKQEIEDIAIGAALLGTGGGGDPYVGKLMALQAVEENGPIELLSVEEINDKALVVPAGMMGAPTVMVEKIPSGNEAVETFKQMEETLGEKIEATLPFEAGGINSMLPLALAAKLKLPVIDVDGMGRAFPELQMTTFYLDGISSNPTVIGDEKGNTVLLNTTNNVQAERIARVSTIQMGGSVMIAFYPMKGKNLKESGIKNILQLEEQIGKSIREAKNKDYNPIERILELTHGFKLFQGKVVDVDRRTETGFTRGSASIEGLETYQGRNLKLQFQNEHLLASVEDEILCTTPDLIAVLDEETGMPVTTEGLRYGARCIIIGIPCDTKWRTTKGIETCGPKYFGYDITYKPVEELIKERSF